MTNKSKVDNSSDKSSLISNAVLFNKISNINKVQKPPLDKEVDYKDVDALSVFVSERGRILPRRITGVSAKMQRRIAKAIKRARMLLLMPFTK